jgi:hypothetical protein
VKAERLALREVLNSAERIRETIAASGTLLEEFKLLASFARRLLGDQP